MATSGAGAGTGAGGSGGESKKEMRKNETDQLVRSNKKAKGDIVEEAIMSETMGESQASEQRVEEKSTVPERPLVSYRDLFRGVNGAHQIYSIRDDIEADDDEDLSDDDEENLLKKQDGPLQPGVDIPREWRINLCRPWRRSLYIKDLGKEVG